MFIVDGLTSIHYAPQVSEFENIVYRPLLRRNSKQYASTVNEPTTVGNSSSSIPDSQANVTKEIHHYHTSHQTKHRYDSSDNTPTSSPVKHSKPRRKRRDTTLQSSPLCSNATIPIGTLSPFKVWCKKDHDPSYWKWDDIFAILSADDI